MMMMRARGGLGTVLLRLLEGTMMRTRSCTRSHGRGGTVLVGGMIMMRAMVSTMARGFGVDTLGDNNLGETRILRGSVSKTLRTNINTGVVRDEVKFLIVRGGDAERLFQETIGSVNILAGVVGTLTIIEFPVGEKTTGDSTRAPTLAIRPTTHSGFTFIEAVDRAGTDGLALNIRETTMHAGDKTKSTGCERRQREREKKGREGWLGWDSITFFDFKAVQSRGKREEIRK
jgi:hypothetical protein